MSLSELVSSMDLAVWPQAALAVFFPVFIAVSVRAIRRPRSEMTHAASLPLDTADPEGEVER